MNNTIPEHEPSDLSYDVVVTKSALVRDILRMGVRTGDHVALGVSFRKMGAVEGGPVTFFDALREVVGSEGTIMIPTYTDPFHIMKYKTDEGPGHFDPATTPSCTGVMSETIRQQKGTIRSRHPHCSIAAFGRLALELTEEHDADAPAYMPYSRLAAHGGKVLCIGIDDNLVGIRHEAQRLAGLLDVIPLRGKTLYKDKDGCIKLFVRRDSGGCIKKLPRLVKSLREKGLVCDGFIGTAASIMVEADNSLGLMTRKLKGDPASFLCDSLSCLWCRELERRMNLYRAIRDPRYFQKSMVAAYTIGLMNQLRLVIDNTNPQTRFAIHEIVSGGKNLIPRFKRFNSFV